MSAHSSGRARMASVLVDALRPPVEDRRFWLIQLLVVAIAVFHMASHDNGLFPHFGIPHFATMSLFLVPVVYAALTFGLAGSLATALWVSVLMTPDVMSHEGIDRWANGIQIAIIDVVAAFVGAKVDSERLLRRDAEEARARYVSLFERSQAPVLVVAADGRIRDMNAAARRTFGLLRGAAEDGCLAELVGAEAASSLLTGGLSSITVRGASGDAVLKPLSTRLEAEGEVLTELVLQDITAELRQQRGTRVYAAHVLQGQENERMRIAAELHDEPLQSLLLLSRQLGDVRGAAPMDDAELIRARELASEVAADLRRISHGLRPPSLDDLGVVSATRQVLAAAERRLGIRTRLDVVGSPRRLAADVELCIFRVAQEAIHNVERHAEASTVAVRARFAADEVTLLVADDGQGFDAAGVFGFDSPTLGILGMRERATMVGGRLEVRSRPGRGTVVRLAVPVQPRWPVDGDPPAPGPSGGPAGELAGRPLAGAGAELVDRPGGGRAEPGARLLESGVER